MNIVIGILCAIIGALAAYIIARLNGHQTNQELTMKAAVLETQLEAAEKAAQEAKDNAATQIASAREDAERRLAVAKAEWQELHQKALEEQRTHFNDISEKLVAEAKNATEAMVKQRQEEIAASGNAAIQLFVEPLKETIEKMERTMNDSTLKQTETNSALKETLQAAMKSNEDTKRTADELVKAFKHDSKVQGDWGERVLEELLESLDLHEGIHFDVQASIRDESGNAIRSEETGGFLRPDVIVHLDAKKDVIVDSKVSTAAFLKYASEDDPDLRKKYLKEHIDSLKSHVKELSKKNYSSYVKAPKETMDFVIMFVPRSAALWTALAEEPKLWRDAMEQNVFIVDEQTLYAALRMVKLTWRQIQQAENQQMVYKLANEMLKRVGAFVKHMDAIGESLEKAQKSYAAGRAKLAEKGQSIVTTCRQLENLGAKQDVNNPIPRSLEEVGYVDVEES